MDDENKLWEDPLNPKDDNDPAAPASDIHPGVPIDDPATDDGVDSDELYQEGVPGVTNAVNEEMGPDEHPEPLDGYDES